VVDLESGGVAAVSAAPAWDELAGTVRHPVYAPFANHLAGCLPGRAAGKGLPLSVIESVCREYAQWSSHGEAPELLLAAVGAPQGGRDMARAAGLAARLLSSLDIDPARLVLVFDCDDLQDDPMASLHAFLALKRLGFKLGVDFCDIESLPFRFLEMLPADFLRVGHEAHHTPMAAPGLADRLRNVAGVDSVSKYDLLSGLHCRFGQGAYFPAVSPSGKSLGLFDRYGPPPGL
jgi:EAL domain-containing protein (putative c-di-GMP-specific phosphodiesterase class I)